MSAKSDAESISEVAKKIACEIDDGEVFEGWIEQRAEDIDFGAARADGVSPENFVTILEVAKHCWDFVKSDVFVMLGIVVCAQQIYDRHFKGTDEDRTDYTREEILRGIECGLRELLEKRDKGPK